jgi:hypothetical protein
MEYIYSKIEPDTLLHFIFRSSEVENRTEQRVDLVSANNFIQCSSLKMKEGITFKPHKHIWKEQNIKVIAQESWIVIKGSVKCILYDLDDKIIAEPILYSGDASFTLLGGHNYLSLEDNSIVMEYKTGPYLVQKLDKTFI